MMVDVDDWVFGFVEGCDQFCGVFNCVDCVDKGKGFVIEIVVLEVDQDEGVFRYFGYFFWGKEDGCWDDGMMR